MSYVYCTVISFLQDKGYMLDDQLQYSELWRNTKEDLIAEISQNGSVVEDVAIYSYDFEERNYIWDCGETESFISDLDLKLLNDSLETDGEQLDKRINRTKDVMIENINSLYDVEFDLNYYSDYILDENLKEANRYVILAIEKIRKFMEK
ncbi:hypothetical protein TaPaz_88 [Acinetobacter phage TaPaz]|nr:hypothetical protein TaPaz_88 [Acinetobacter phage TaPaz]